MMVVGIRFGIVVFGSFFFIREIIVKFIQRAPRACGCFGTLITVAPIVLLVMVNTNVPVYAFVILHFVDFFLGS